MTRSCRTMRTATAIVAFASLTMIALVSPASAPAQSAEPWPIKEFEVLNVEPAGEVAPFGAFVALLREADIDLDNPLDLDLWKTVPLPDETKQAIETHLRESALLLEQWGFAEPALEPVVRTRAGSDAYRVFLVRDLVDIAGRYHPLHCNRGNETVILLDADDIMDASGLITPHGLSTVGHELFHAVQFATPFFASSCGEEVGHWITEGQAEAVGWDLVRALRKGVDVDSRGMALWEPRSYSNRLPIPRRKPGPGKDPAYETASFWRYLAEFQALRTPPGPEVNSFDYSYLASMLDRPPAQRDCSTSEAACHSELRWLDLGVQRAFGLTLRKLYPRFVDAFAVYGEHRLADATLQYDWEHAVFNLPRRDASSGCEHVYLTPEPRRRVHREVIALFEPVATECWSVLVEGFEDDVLVQIEVKAPPGATALSDLLAVVAGRPIFADTAVMHDDPETGQPTATWVKTFPLGESRLFLLTNVARDPANTTRMINLPITFTPLEPYAVMTSITSSPGPSGDEVDRPIGVRFDHVPTGTLFDAAETRYEHDPGLAEPCVLRALGFSNARGDQLSFGMDHEGPIGPDEYTVAPFTRHYGAKHERPWEEWPPGMPVVSFVLGADNPMSGGRAQSFHGMGGTLLVESVEGRFLQGVLNVSGVNHDAEDIERGFPPPSIYVPNATILVEFGLLVRDPGDPIRDSGAIQCLTSDSRGRAGRGSGRGPGDSGDMPDESPDDPSPSPDPRDSPDSLDSLDPDGTDEAHAEHPGEPGPDPAPDGEEEEVPGRPAEAATGQLGPGKTRWVRVWAKDRPDLSFSGSDLDGTAGATFTCWTGNPVNISLYEGDTARNAKLGVTFITTPPIPEGATGAYRIDQVLYVFQGGALGWRGPVTLELTRHDASTDPGARRVIGRILGLRVVDRTTGALIPIEAEFDVNAACAPFGR